MRIFINLFCVLFALSGCSDTEAPSIDRLTSSSSENNFLQQFEGIWNSNRVVNKAEFFGRQIVAVPTLENYSLTVVFDSDKQRLILLDNGKFISFITPKGQLDTDNQALYVSVDHLNGVTTNLTLRDVGSDPNTIQMALLGDQGEQEIFGFVRKINEEDRQKALNLAEAAVKEYEQTFAERVAAEKATAEKIAAEKAAEEEASAEKAAAERDSYGKPCESSLQCAGDLRCAIPPNSDVKQCITFGAWQDIQREEIRKQEEQKNITLGQPCDSQSDCPNNLICAQRPDSIRYRCVTPGI